MLYLDMDLNFRGKTWIGNIYDKFEAICHEVDGLVKQDTVKYVESHVQTVGESMKKLYSDVVQDIIPSSLEEPVKYISKEVSLNVSKSAENYVVSTLAIEVKDEDDDTKQSSKKQHSTSALENIQMSSVTGHQISKEIFASSVTEPIGESESDICSKKNDGNFNCNNSGLCGKQNFEEQSQLEELRNKKCEGPAKSLVDSESTNQFHKNGEANTPVDILSYDVGLEPSVEEETGWESFSDDEPNSSGPFICESSDVAFPIVSCKHKTAEVVVASSGSSLATESCYLEFPCVMLSPRAETTSGCSASARGAYAFTGIADPTLETIDLSDKVRLDEGCVVVDSKLLRDVSTWTMKHRSYKKLIQDVFASRKRLEKEYQRLGILYGDIDMECRRPLEQSSVSSSIPVTSSILKESPSNDLGNSDWEFV